jgi:hypothetical protein
MVIKLFKRVKKGDILLYSESSMYLKRDFRSKLKIPILKLSKGC